MSKAWVDSHGGFFFATQWSNGWDTSVLMWEGAGSKSCQKALNQIVTTLAETLEYRLLRRGFSQTQF